ncbi:hypothetical protein CDCA_CDCA13G3673 [Cyanidium caldarium]|uniref:Uncharacterized protein n=1 Tax=Cyanidium caldarium TaxID=2771 RepID=A0AAV9J0U2_CYACA|nr:hypothetical protein CDCA_CDCA13G3673 [Cyanidium caldarium]
MRSLSRVMGVVRPLRRRLQWAPVMGAERRGQGRCLSGVSDEGRIAAGAMGRTWQDRQTSQENMYFSKEDELMLKRLSSKLSRQVAPSAEQLADNRSVIGSILKKHGVQPTPELVEELVSYKYGVQQ